MEQPKLTKRQANIKNYLESFFSENRIRQIYALFLSGDHTKYLSNQISIIEESYKYCPREHKATAAGEEYAFVILYLVTMWDKSKRT